MIFMLDYYNIQNTASDMCRCIWFVYLKCINRNEMKHEIREETDGRLGKV